MSVLFKILNIVQNAYNRGDIHIHTHTYLWTIEKVGHKRIDAFELWYWRRLFRVPWTARDPTSPS